MPELIIGAVLGALTIISAIGILVSIWLVSQQRQLFQELDELDDHMHGDVGALGDSMQRGFSLLESAMKALAGKHGLAWDAESGEWRKVQ